MTVTANRIMGENPAVSIHPPLRLVSLVPSLTELLVALGLRQYLVGRTGFCIHPRDQVVDIPKLGGTKDVHLTALAQIAATHVFVNVDETRLETVDALRLLGLQVIVTHPCTPGDNLQLIDQIVSVVSNSNAIDSVALNALFMRAEALKSALKTRLAALLRQQHLRPMQRVLYLIWREPWMSVARDTYISRMLALINWQTWPDVHGGDGLASPGCARYPVISPDAPWLTQIDRVLLSSEPFHFCGSHVLEVQQWMSMRGSYATVTLVDGELLSWYGARAAPGLDYLDSLARSAPSTSSA